MEKISEEDVQSEPQNNSGLETLGNNKWINKFLRKPKKPKREISSSTDLVHKSKIPVLKLKNKNSTIKNLFFHKIVNAQNETNLEISYSLGKITANKECGLQKLSASCTKFEVKDRREFVPTRNIEEFGLNSFFQISKLTQFIPKKLTFDGLRELTQLSDQIRESETYLIQTVSKYVKSPGVVQNLLDTFSKHANLSAETEQRVQRLAHEVWLQQSEIMKHREFTLQSSLDALTKLNRKLQAENETLTQKNENLGITTISQFPNSDLGNQLMDTLKKSNENLRQKTRVLLANIEEQDQRIRALQEENQSLEKQLFNLNSQLFNFKTLVQRIQNQQDLDDSSLTRQLQDKQEILNDCIRIGASVWATMKNDANNYHLDLKDREKSLPDLITFCQSSIDGLRTQLQTIKAELDSSQRTNYELSQKLKTAEESLARSEQERTFCLANAKGSKENFEYYQEKCKSFKDEIEEANEKLKRAIESVAEEKAKSEGLVVEVANLKKRSIEKKEEFIFNKEKLAEYKLENDSLRMQLHGLKQVLETAGSGDVARELAETHEKMTCFQSQYYQMLSEKNFLVEQLQTANVDRETFNRYQTMYYQFIQTQQQEIQAANGENAKLKQALESKTGQMLALQAQQTKLADERNVMKGIYQQLKAEINRAQKLEGAVAGINLEASKLAIIADYNKQLGEKLQCEMTEKEVKISELESSVLELNNAQIEYTKDKVALCVELSEVFNINNQLNNSLIMEQEKIATLDESKRSLEESVSCQMKAVEEMQKTERQALKELLRDYKSVVMQRDNYHNALEESKKEVVELQAKNVAQNKKLEVLTKKYADQQESMQSLARELNVFEKELALAKDDRTKLESLRGVLTKELDQQSQNIQSLESSKTYLQNTLQKLHHELNEERKLKTELERQLIRHREDVKQQLVSLEEVRAAFDKVSTEKRELAGALSTLQEAHDALKIGSQDLSTNAKEESEKVKTLTEEIAALKRLFDETECQHHAALAKKEMELFDVEDYCKNLQLELQQIEYTAEDIDTQSKLLSKSSTEQAELKRLVNTLKIKQEKHEKMVEMLKEENDKLEEALKLSARRSQIADENHRREVEDLEKRYNEHKQEMITSIENLSLNFTEIEKRYLKERHNHLKLIGAHKELAAKLLKSIRMLIEEKLHRQELDKKVQSHSKQIDLMASEKEATEKMAGYLSQEVDALKQRLEEAACDKQNLQRVLADVQEMYRNLSKEKKASSGFDLNSPNSSKVSTEGNGENIQDRTKQLRADLELAHDNILQLKIEISNLNQQLTVMEFQKCEISLRLHENLQKLKNEENLNAHLTKIHQNVLSTILQLNHNKTLSRTACDALLKLIQGAS